MSATSDHYLNQADRCAADAAASPLIQVRERCLRAEKAWRSMADQLIRSETVRAEREKMRMVADNDGDAPPGSAQAG